MSASDFSRATAISMLLTGLCFSTISAYAEEPAAPGAAAPTAVAAVKERVFLTRAVAVGGLRDGMIMMISEDGMEHISASHLARLHRQPVSKLNGLDQCVP